MTNNNWDLVPLGQFLTERQEKPEFDDLITGKIPIIEKITFNDGKIHLRNDGKTKTGMILIKPGDLVLSGINACKGAVAIYDQKNTQSIAGTIHYGSYIPNKNKIDIKFLWYLLRSHKFQELLLEYVPGGIKTELKAKRFLPIPIPLPPLTEQKRIVAKIEQLATKIEEARHLRLETIESDVPHLRNAIFSEVFKSKINKNSYNWQLLRLSDVCSMITDGTHQTPTYTSSGMMFLSAQNIKPYKFMPENHKYVSNNDYLIYTSSKKAEKGDILLTRVGANIGEAAMIDQDLDFAFYVSLCLIKPIKEYVYAPYLVHWLNSPEGVAKSKKNTLGKGHSQGNLNLKLIRNFLLPIPTLSEQKEIVKYLDNVQSKIDEMKKLRQQNLKELEALLPSILDQAFKGEL